MYTGMASLAASPLSTSHFAPRQGTKLGILAPEINMQQSADGVVPAKMIYQSMSWFFLVSTLAGTGTASSSIQQLDGHLCLPFTIDEVELAGKRSGMLAMQVSAARWVDTPSG